ncbi:sensor histidine kinase [Methylobacterium nodulans]|uniref:Blue-light-activated histidine kinase n=1 Tax=Methylobacterium nodulans (strain LMG 21967 / CNCM I-2342 / ORS 2060) TaxID=460265 RepID=B8IES2_METNO|nr:PAS domain-containing protein [Methylobacterium nodulans]ACL61415.1 signal transduction histidine kinase [Methylobacterium nodulans ORS 2060]
MNLRLFSQACGVLAILAGLLVLLGWGAEITALQSVVPGFPAAQPMTALAMAFCGGALLFQGVKHADGRRAAVGLASAVVVVSLLNLAAYAGLDLGLDRWLFSDRLANQPGPYPHPGRMAEVTALCFLLMAFATAAKARRRMALPAVAAATVALVLASVALLAYLFDASILEVAGFSALSLPTAVVLVVLSGGALAAEPLRGWPRRLTLGTLGGSLSRVLLPLAVIVPIGIGAAAMIATRAGYVPPDLRLIAVCAVTAVLLGAGVMWAAGRIDGLDAARQRYRQLYEAQRTAHLVLAPDFTIEEASESYLEATMTQRQELVGKGLFEAFPDNPADPGATGARNLRASLERVLKNRASDRMPVQQYDIRRPSGEFEVRWWSPLNSPVFGPDGEVRHIIHQVEDVTAEMLERQAAAEARAGEARVRAVADAIPGLVFETDPAGWNTYVNEQYGAYTGLPTEALLGDGWRQVFHPDDRDRAAATWQETVGSNRPFEMECRIRRAEGVWRWFMLRISALRDRAGRVEKGIGVCTDITDQREASELQRTLLLEVSHRVKNSLALISGLLTLQARPLGGAARRALEEASQRVHAVARVHDQLWRGAGTRDIDLRPFLCDLCSAVGTTAPRHSTVCHAEPAIVSADLAVPLGLFVNELLTNAYKYAYPAGEEGEVRVLGTNLPDGRYRLEVSDAGRGLPPGFDLAKSRESLGMRVITRLAAQLGGELTAGAAEPGARFILVFLLRAG